MRVALLLLFASFSCLFAQETDLQKQVDALKKDVETLKTQQVAIIQYLNELRGMLKQQQSQNAVVDIKSSPFTGSKNAKVALVEFTDYWCGFCARFAKQTQAEIMKKYVETGKIRYYLKDFAAQRGTRVAEAARCAGDQDKYWPMHDQLFANYGKYGDDELVTYAKNAGADPSLFQKCVESGRHTNDVRQDMDAGQKAGVDGTPTFVIGVIDPADPGNLKASRTIVGAQSLDAFQAALDGVLADAK